MLKAETICRRCGRVDEIIQPMLKKKTVYNGSGEELELLYYTCPQCKTDVVVQIDNQVTKGLLSDCFRIVHKAMESGRNGKKTSQKQQKKYFELSKHLRINRSKLMDLYKGSEMYDKEGNILIKGLTVSGGSGIIENKM